MPGSQDFTGVGDLGDGIPHSFSGPEGGGGDIGSLLCEYEGYLHWPGFVATQISDLLRHMGPWFTDSGVRV